MSQRKSKTRRPKLAEYVRLLLESTAGGIVGVDAGGRITFINHAGAELLGYTPDEVVGQDVHSLFHHDGAAGSSHPPQECPILRTLSAGQGCRIDNECFRRKNGTAVPVGYSSQPVRQDGVVSGAVVTFNDISAQRTAEEALKESELDLTERRRAEADGLALEKRLFESQKLESLGKLAGGVAHVFNNLLTVIQGHVEMATAQTPATSPLCSHLQEIATAAQRAAELAGTMLVYSGKARISSRLVDLNTLVADTGRLTATALPPKIVLHYRLADNLPALDADAAQLRQLVMNLMVNAAEAIGDPGGTVTVSTGVVHASDGLFAECYPNRALPEGEYVYVEVEDTGCGMDSATQARVFDPFFSTKFTGRGLGLPTVLGIVRAHEGTILLRSRPGSGTTFTVFLPAHSACAAKESRGGPPAQRTGVILVVDDEEGIRTLAQALLENEGYSVLTAADGDAALDTLRQHDGSISAVVLDVIMPRMNGEQVLREIRDMKPDLPVLVMSGYSEEVLSPRFEGMGAVSFLGKPFSGAVLCSRLGELLGNAKTQKP
ncbi:MAG: response regulator [Planctomycetota bacterium]|nr:response regulator [Planctomycetota bacterium]